MFFTLLVFCPLLDNVLTKISDPVDLTHPFDTNTWYWFDSKQFHFTRQGVDSYDGVFVASNDFEAGEHGGTHMDAPYHFNKNGWKIGDIPFHRFYANAVVINAAEEAAKDPDYQLGVNKILEWEKRNGPVPKNSIILINYGWAKKYDNWSEYFGSPVRNISTLHFPGLSEEAADWIVRTGHVVGVGSDTPSADFGQSKKFQAHVILNNNNIFILENVALNVTDLPEKGFNIFALPMKIRYGTGAPCRVVAVP